MIWIEILDFSLSFSKDNYGKRLEAPEKKAKVDKIYEELEILQRFQVYEKKFGGEIECLIGKLPKPEQKSLFKALLSQIYGREK